MFFFQHVVVHQIRQAQFDGLIIYQKCNYWGKTIGKLLVSFTDILSKFIFTVHFSMMYTLCTLSKQEIHVLQRNGQEVAVKVFSTAAMQRSPEVQVREFQVMMQLKHENVVQLLSIEEEVSGTAGK